MTESASTTSVVTLSGAIVVVFSPFFIVALLAEIPFVMDALSTEIDPVVTLLGAIDVVETPSDIDALLAEIPFVMDALPA